MLRLEGISAAYGTIRALSDISLTVDAGKFVAIVGPNGAGKTTLFRVISGLLAPTGGASCSRTAISWRCRPKIALIWASPMCPKAGRSSATLLSWRI